MTTTTQRRTLERRAGPSAGFFAYHGLWAPGIRLFRNLRFVSKAAIISLAFLLPMMTMVGWQVWTGAEEALQARMDATRQHVEIARGVVESAHAREQSGELSRAAAQALALSQLERLRYDGKEYFWVNDEQPRMLMHPFKKELNGKFIGEMADPNGHKLFRTMVDTVQAEGGGFVFYQWPRPGASAPEDKVSFVAGFKPWGWIVGSGVYVSDITAATHRKAGIAAVGLALAMVFAGYFFTSFYRVIDGGLRETRKYLRAMTAGDLTMSPSPWGKDEAAQLMLDLRTMQEALRGIVSRVRGSSNSIETASSEIATASLDLSSRTEETAANLEQTAAAMDQISATVQHTSTNVRDAADIARENQVVACEGSDVIARVVQTMHDISMSSKRISDITGTIDGIAFQTNILALNAAVEAARAGEEGKGFAVVAEEVRSLAHRCAQAAKEIKSLIHGSLEHIETGSQVAAGAGGAMQKMMASAERLNDLLDQISTASAEESAGVAQIGTAVADLDRMTQQNAALVEQSAAAAGSLRDQARSLAVEVAAFRLPA